MLHHLPGCPDAQMPSTLMSIIWLSSCPAVLYPDVTHPDVLYPDVIHPDVLYLDVFYPEDHLRPSSSLSGGS